MSTVTINEPGTVEAYPTHRLCAILATIQDVRLVLDELIASGMKKEDVDILYGGRGAQIVNADQEDSLVLNEIGRPVISMGDVDNELNRVYEAALLAGSIVMRIPCDDEDEAKAAVTRILERHHANHINYFGNWVVEAL